MSTSADVVRELDETVDRIDLGLSRTPFWWRAVDVLQWIAFAALVVGVGWGAYALARPGHVAQEWAAIAPHLASGALTPPIGATFGLDDAAQALAEIDERRATGKVLLVP